MRVWPAALGSCTPVPARWRRRGLRSDPPTTGQRCLRRRPPRAGQQVPRGRTALGARLRRMTPCSPGPHRLPPTGTLPHPPNELYVASRAVAARRSEIRYSCVELSRVVCDQVSAGLCAVIQRNHEVAVCPRPRPPGGRRRGEGRRPRPRGAFPDRAEVHRNAKPVRGGLVVGGDRRAGEQQPTGPKPAGDRAQQRSVRRRRDVAERVTGRHRIDRPRPQRKLGNIGPDQSGPWGGLPCQPQLYPGQVDTEHPVPGPKAVGPLLDLAM